MVWLLSHRHKPVKTTLSWESLGLGEQAGAGVSYVNSSPAICRDV